MRRTLFTVAYLGLGMALGMMAVAPSKAQQADEVVRFKITNPGQALYKVAIPRVLGEGAAAQVMTEVVANDLALSGFFKVLDPASFVADLAKENLNITPDSWKTVGAESVIKARVSQSGGDLSVEFRLFEVVKGETAVLTKNYRAGEAAQTMLGATQKAWFLERLRGAPCPLLLAVQDDMRIEDVAGLIGPPIVPWPFAMAASRPVSCAGAGGQAVRTWGLPVWPCWALRSGSTMGFPNAGCSAMACLGSSSGWTCNGAWEFQDRSRSWVTRSRRCR